VNAAVRGLPAIKMMWTGHSGKHMQSTVGRGFLNWNISIPQPLTLRTILYNLKTLDDSFCVSTCKNGTFHSLPDVRRTLYWYDETYSWMYVHTMLIYRDVL
jgi:hypothetical protein